MDSKDIVHFVESVRNVFTTMLQLEVEVDAPALREPNEPCRDVSAIIGMSGDVVGTVVLSFPSQTATRIVALFVGAEVQEEDADFADAIGELVNMVAGGAKAKLDNRRVDITCPSVVIGSGHRVFQPKNRPILEVPCDCECGPFALLVAMKNEEELSADATVAAGAER